MALPRLRIDIGRNLRRFFGYLAPYRFRFALVFVLLAVFSVLQLLNPIIFGWIVDLAAKQADWRAIEVLLACFGGIVVLRAGLLLWRNYLLQRVGMRVTCDMRIDVFAHLQKLSIRFYEARHTGKIVARVTEDTGAVHNMVTAASVNLVSDFLTIVLVLAFLLTQNLKLTLVTYAVLPFFVFNYLWHRRRMRLENRQHRRHWDGVISFLHERIASTRLVKSFATEESEIDTFRDEIEGDYFHYNRVVWRNTLLSAGAELFSGLGSLAVLGYGAYLAFYEVDGFTIGKLVAFNFLLTLLYAPIVRMVDANAAIQRAATALEKIFTLLDTQPHVPDNEQKPSIPPVAGRIEFQNVDFSYRPSDPVLHEIDFTAEPGKMIALVGPSGSGKSTVVSLLARFYEPTRGVIRIDGADIQDFNTQSVRRQIGVVMQDNVLFSGTLEENLKYGRPDATREEMVEAARAANIDEFIASLPRGYQSEVGERGVQLSGGQRQRIAIARVLLKNPRILIFDEATSALDTKSERLIQEATERVMRGRTSIVIAHRLSTVLNADRILVLHGGRIVESGTHRELLAQGGLYRELYDLQERH